MKCSLVKQMFHSRFLGPFSMSQTLVKLYKLCQKTTVSIYLIYLIYLNLEKYCYFYGFNQTCYFVVFVVLPS